jgi:hypothetical protein
MEAQAVGVELGHSPGNSKKACSVVETYSFVGLDRALVVVDLQFAFCIFCSAHLLIHEADLDGEGRGRRVCDGESNAKGDTGVP